MAAYNGLSQSMISTEDGNSSLLSGASDNTSIWDGRCDPASVQLRNMRKNMNKMARIFAKEYSIASRLPELELADDGPDVDIKRSELVNGILGYITTGQVLVSNGCGDQQAAMTAIADSIRTARKVYESTKFLVTTSVQEKVIPSHGQIVAAVQPAQQ